MTTPLKPPISSAAANNVTSKRTEPLLVNSSSNNDNSNHTSVNKTCDVALSRQQAAAAVTSTAAAAVTGGKRDPSPPKLSYSVNFFNWSVSDCSSEEENEDCRNVTMSLNRLKIRKSSKERNEKSARGSNL